MYRPSGETRGENRPTEFGTRDTFPVIRSRRDILPPWSFDAKSFVPKMMDFPSGVQVGSASFTSVPTITLGLPPDGETRQIFQGLSNRISMKAICEPSGDQRGPYTLVGG